MKIIYRLIILLLIMFITSNCIQKQIPKEHNNIDLFAIIARETSGMKVNEKKEVKLGVSYDMILVIPPYTSKKDLDKLNLQPKIIAAISQKMPNGDNFHFFLIKNGNINAYTIFDSQYATKDNAIIKVTYPNLLKFEKKQREYRPIEIG